MRYDRGPPKSPSKAFDHGMPQEANSKKKIEEESSGTLFPLAIKLDGARKVDPDLSANIEKVRYKVVRTLPCRTALDRRVIRHPPQP